MGARTNALGLAFVAALAGVTSCVRSDVHEATLRDLQEARTDASQKGVQISSLQREIGGLGQQLQAMEAKLADASTAQADLDHKLEDLMVLNAELSTRLKAAGQNVEQLAAERGSLAQALADTRARLEELKKQQAVAEARAAQFRDLVSRFQRMVDAGRLAVVIRQGRMLLELPSDQLFDGTRADLKSDGRGTLRDVAKVLKTMPDRKFQISGHTDNAKIQGGRFSSSWELSTARAVEVLKRLVEAGMDPHNLSAAGYGEFAPAGSNDTAEGRAHNRRIEIALIPNLDEIIKVPGTSESPAPAPKPVPAAPAPSNKPTAAAPKR